MKVKVCLVEEKKHIRFYDWSTADVSREFLLEYAKEDPQINNLIPYLDWSVEQTFVFDFKASNLSCELEW